MIIQGTEQEEEERGRQKKNWWEWGTEKRREKREERKEKREKRETDFKSKSSKRENWCMLQFSDNRQMKQKKGERCRSKCMIIILSERRSREEGMLLVLPETRCFYTSIWHLVISFLFLFLSLLRVSCSFVFSSLPLLYTNLPSVEVTIHYPLFLIRYPSITIISLVSWWWFPLSFLLLISIHDRRTNFCSFCFFSCSFFFFSIIISFIRFVFLYHEKKERQASCSCHLILTLLSSSPFSPLTCLSIDCQEWGLHWILDCDHWSSQETKPAGQRKEPYQSPWHFFLRKNNFCCISWFSSFFKFLYLHRLEILDFHDPSLSPSLSSSLSLPDSGPFTEMIIEGNSQPLFLLCERYAACIFSCFWSFLIVRDVR